MPDFPVRGTDLAVRRYDSHRAFLDDTAARVEADRRRAEVEDRLLRSEERLDVPGDCYVCGRSTLFRVSFEYAIETPAGRRPNWREVLHCRGCGLNNRIRAALHFLGGLFGPSPRARIYLTEQVGALYDHLRARHAGLVGSEYFPAGTPPPAGASGLRHEDLRRLSFPADTFDFVLSFDVLEHVPHHLDALRELHRVLRPGGRMLFSVPFRADRPTNLTRAVVEEDGSITHLHPPEYHGDPLRSEGCLAFHQFGWELLDDLRAVGFREAGAYFYWSRGFAYLGRDQRLFAAVK